MLLSHFAAAADVDRIQGDADRIGQAAIESRRTRLECAQTSLRVDLMARMDYLQDINTKIRDDIAVNFGAVDAVRRANDNTRDELARCPMWSA